MVSPGPQRHHEVLGRRLKTEQTTDERKIGIGIHGHSPPDELVSVQT